ncbi:MAG: aromatic ring-hydroxylating dioxygenase subunit alpha [Anaerolineae bacterium]|nr:aromatic ring-hydroxylating dioxygenase subunit alpha [Anaerolineae bacterium]
MIRDQWYAILESKEVKRGKPVGVTRLGEKLVLWRDEQGQVVCQRDKCPHRGVQLSLGELKDGTLECPFHGFRFDPTGQCTLIPAIGKTGTPPKKMKVHTYPAREAHDLIWVWWGDPRDDLPPIHFFETIDDSFSYATLKDHWPTHYSRAIENQLDVVHLPFVHRTTIGRGNKTVVNGPLTEVDCEIDGCNRLEVWLNNEVDRGQTPIRPREFTRPDRHPQLQFQFPNIWHNWISDDVRVFIAFVPIDAENTLMVIRFYQRFMRVPLLRTLVNWFSLPFNFWIERQDKRVVVTHQPPRADLDIGETLIQGDGPIITYRKRRRELIEAARQNMDTET